MWNSCFNFNFTGEETELEKDKTTPYYLDCKYENQMHIFWFSLDKMSNKSILISEFCESMAQQLFNLISSSYFYTFFPLWQDY